MKMTNQILTKPEFKVCTRSKFVDVTYRGLKLIKIQCKSLADEVKLHTMARLKTIAADSSQLVLLSLEDLVVPDRSAIKQTLRIDPEVLAQAKKAREDLNGKIANKAVGSCEDVQELIDGPAEKLVLTDPTFRIEVALLDLLGGSAAEKKFLSDCMQHLPTAEVEVKPAIVAQRWHVISQSVTHKLAPVSLQAMFKSLQNIITSIVAGNPPDVSACSKHPQLSEFVMRMQFFVRVLQPG